MKRLEITILSSSNAFLRSDYSVETQRNTSRHAERNRRFAVYKHDRFFNYLCWKQEDIFLWIISVFCIYGLLGVVQIRDVFLLLSSKTNARARQDLHDSKQYCCLHTHCYNQHNMKGARGGFNDKDLVSIWYSVLLD